MPSDRLYCGWPDSYKEWRSFSPARS
ncbi:hypothetical protein LINPERPRIM_LOCUS42128 [Linum perenne]